MTYVMYSLAIIGSVVVGTTMAIVTMFYCIMLLMVSIM